MCVANTNINEQAKSSELMSQSNNVVTLVFGPAWLN